MPDFLSDFGKVADLVSGKAKGVLNKFDHMIFNALIGCLKSNDYDAVRVAIEQLEKEQKPVSIPPLYFVAKAHPNNLARERAELALASFKQDEKIAQLTAGKEVKEAVSALIQEFGNYRG